MRETALDTVEKIFRAELSNEDIFKMGADVAEWSRERFADFVVHVQKILRDICFVEVLEPYNPDLAARLSGIKIPERKILSMIETGAEFHRQLKSNANLRLLVEMYLLSLRRIH